MIKIDLTASLDKICDKMKDHIKEKVINNVEEATKILYDEVKNECPVDTGALKNSITYDIEEGNNTVTGIITAGEPYCSYVMYGTGIHAKNGKGRNTPWTYQDSNGNWHYTFGQHANNFFEKAKNNKEEELENILKNCKWLT